MFHITLLWLGEKKVKKKRRRKPGASFLLRHLTGSLWRLQLWKMKISSVVFALLTRALLRGKKSLLCFIPKGMLLEMKCFPQFFCDRLSRKHLRMREDVGVMVEDVEQIFLDDEMLCSLKNLLLN